MVFGVEYVLNGFLISNQSKVMAGQIMPSFSYSFNNSWSLLLYRRLP